MKNVIKHSKKILFAVAMLTVLVGNAKDKSSALKKGLIKTALTIDNVKEGNLLSIKDQNGLTLYKELIVESGTYRKGFDLTALPDGDYFFEVDKDIEIKTIPFTVKSNKVVFKKDEEVTVFKPFVREKDGFVYISKLAPNYASLKISIYGNYNNDYQLLYSDKFENLQTIEKAYKLETGSYKIVLNSDNNEYTKFINN
ncbi:hypothetical protein [Algibacter sp. L4_22]|uniref:hypothetical protein n=1 Tax=Algibacter sp. L4_22 TaxID=2942477 RepID=UPI00201B656A|nr:hypothetical protein [Algibacter sp. L4_22]MCL5127022.1 hypothetical protein [Algibacter sp. L4_22]